MTAALWIGPSPWQAGLDWARVRQLLAECYDEIEALWAQDPLSDLLAQAVVVKEYMVDHGIPPQEVVQGIRSYLEFRAEQQRLLWALGFCGHSVRPSRSN